MHAHKLITLFFGISLLVSCSKQADSSEMKMGEIVQIAKDIRLQHAENTPTTSEIYFRGCKARQ